MSERIFLDEVSDILRIKQDRRSFMTRLLLGAAGTAFGSLTSVSPPYAATVDSGRSAVSFVTGSDRREMVYQALKPLEKKVKKEIKGKQVILKPNLVGNNQPLCATHADALRGVLDFLKPIYKQQVLIGESTGRRYEGKSGTFTHYELYNYLDLEREYNVKLVDLNARPPIVQWVLSSNGHPLDVRIIDSFLDPKNYIISACRLKTHNCMVVTLSAKNMLMAAPINDDIRHEKKVMHSPGIRNMNFNFFLLSQKIKPALTVLDGLEGMEGNGPTTGTPVNHGVALASTDFVAADRIGCQLMGVDFGDVGYLTYSANGGIGQGDLSKIDIIGPDPANYVKKYKMHERFEGMLEWKV
ncbi:MAG: DUF362 domain-containing protein [Candidatus Latescibacteria bacterium]|nr:DUF362 domain-containing protein [Candidatus Latescibacterota bacterium]